MTLSLRKLLSLALVLALPVLTSCRSNAGLSLSTENPESSTITGTFDSTTEFRIFRRRPSNNHWDGGRAYPNEMGTALLIALQPSLPWDGKSHAIAYGTHAYTTGLTIGIAWSNWPSDSRTRTVTLCYGNRLFWFGNSIYQIPEASYAVVDDLFPENRP
jgi:hypothetical protein